MKVMIDSNIKRFSFGSNSHISKKLLKEQEQKVSRNVIAPAVNMAKEKLDDAASENILRKLGVSYCEVKDNIIKIACGYNGGFYTVKFPIASNLKNVKSYLASALTDDISVLGGLKNYTKLIEDTKRQDIVQKGLRIHTYELNNSITHKDKELAAENLSKFLKYHINEQKLFFVEDEAFYYSKYSNTVYSVNAYPAAGKSYVPTVRECMFTKDDSGNVIGYTTKDWNYYYGMPSETIYTEQQKVSESLPAVAEPDNNKLFAESFRFGNSPNFANKSSIELILKNLASKVGKTNPSLEKLQFIKFYDKNKNIVKRIGYYDATIGRSLIFDKEGNYKYQIEYNKDSLGNITACNRF